MKIFLNLFLFLSLGVGSLFAQETRSFNGSLGQGDLSRESGEWYDSYTFKVLKGQKFVATMTSGDFDTFLIIQSPSGNSWENDDFDGESVSQLDIIATEGGEWTAWASSYGAEMVGEYDLTIEPGIIVDVATTSGRLDHQDNQALKGEYYDTHTFDGSGDVQIQVELLSLGFDGFLILTSPAGNIWRNDDTGSTSMSRIGPVAGMDGKWRIDVTSASAGEVGAYDVIISQIPIGE